LKLVLTILLLAGIALYGDTRNLTGQWAGDASTDSQGQHTVYPFVLILKHEGGAITGTMGPRDHTPQEVKTPASITTGSRSEWIRTAPR